MGNDFFTAVKTLLSVSYRILKRFAISENLEKLYTSIKILKKKINQKTFISQIN